ncbi:MAG: hypothetical protein PHU14_10235 [Methylovulum sp.]|nr:hypothetical protein [Methylovulum sp.]
MKKPVLTPLLAIVLTVGNVCATTLDCEQPSLPLDVAICEDVELLMVNGILEATWDELSPKQKKALLDDQQHWKKTYPVKCAIPLTGKPAPLSAAAKSCAITEIADRTEFLNAQSEKGK